MDTTVPDPSTGRPPRPAWALDYPPAPEHRRRTRERWVTPTDADDRAVLRRATDRQRRQIEQHRLTMPLARRLIAAADTGCELCGEIVPIVVDHAHACCPTWRGVTNGSCGRCVRGFLCQRCNLALGAIDRLRTDPAWRAAVLAYYDHQGETP